jgi:hypothetical protein
MMTEQQNGAQTEAGAPSLNTDASSHSHPQNTAGWCICARDGDRWMCQDRPRFDSDSEGRCCALGGIAKLAETDTWDRYSAQVLAENPCGGTDADA